MISVGKRKKALDEPQLQEEQESEAVRLLRSRLSRRQFLHLTGMAAALAAVAPSLLNYKFRGGPAAGVGIASASVDEITDTLNGLVAFIVPGPDRYSEQQGHTDDTLGGIDADIVGLLAASLDALVPTPPGEPPFSVITAFILNDLAGAVDPDPDEEAAEEFPSHFARLSFEQKLAVFGIMEDSSPTPPPPGQRRRPGQSELAPLGGFLPFIVGFLVYSDATAPHPDTGRPIGWEISNYDGVLNGSNGRPEFKGYFRDVQEATESN